MIDATDVEALAAGVAGGDRASLARAITLVESELPAHAPLARDLLTRLAPRAVMARRVGISGVPGAGKSTFIDALGMQLLASGFRVAVLAIDPSSTRSGGSILGDKTRMQRLARERRAFIRPSPTGGTLGGVSRKTRETLSLCEAAGFDVVLVETVGVGQSETLVADLVDVYLVLMLAGAGDELQGIKRGILEVADVLAINKADGHGHGPAQGAQAQLQAALRLMRGASAPGVRLCSALHEEGLEDVWGEVLRRWEADRESGRLEARRRAQDVRWMWRLIEDELHAALRAQPRVRSLLPHLEAALREGQTTASAAARDALAVFTWPPEAP